MINRDKSRGKSSYKNSYATKLANMKACKSLSVKIIKQLSSCNEPTHGLEKVLRNFSDLVAIFDNSRYKVCDDTFEKWLKLTSQLKLSAKTHLTDLSSEVSKRYKMKFDGTISKKPLKNVKSSKRGDSKRSSKRSSLLQSKRISRVSTKKALNSSKEEFGISRSFSKPFLNQERAAEYHCNILVEKDPINEHQILSSFGGTPCHEKENRIISFEEKVKSKKLEAPCEDGNIMLSSPKGSVGLNDSESMDEPNQFPPMKTEKNQNEEINFSDVQTTNFFNPPKVEEKVHASQNDKSNIAHLKIKDKENEHKGIFNAESSHELEDSPIKKASIKLSKWVENVKQEKYQSDIYSQKFESKRSIKQMKVGRYLEAEQPDESHNQAHEYTSLGKSTENVSYSSHQSNEFSKYLESHADKVKRNREAEERMNKILYSVDTNSL
ncbi:unnamed protein product [Moneuplotes crassus]|uniref:Uncharacterized protein n=1 Tax=Euplotes crassus TaxID=5936 RepID=A0AAD1U399_EUPCR|nr:unnamed protein product [Moneuplotes crassus]